jgi:hypothetical protein
MGWESRRAEVAGTAWCEEYERIAGKSFLKKISND